MKILAIVPLLATLLCVSACQSTPTQFTPTQSAQSVPNPSTTQAVHRTPSGTPITLPTLPQATAQTQSAPQAQAVPLIEPPDTVKKVWRLAQITGTDEDGKLNQALATHPISIDLTQAPKGSAYTGCNSMNFNIKMTADGRFGFGGVTTTRKICFDVMSLELALAKYVRATRYYQLGDDGLILYGQSVKLHLVPN